MVDLKYKNLSSANHQFARPQIQLFCRWSRYYCLHQLLASCPRPSICHCFCNNHKLCIFKQPQINILSQKDITRSVKYAELYFSALHCNELLWTAVQSTTMTCSAVHFSTLQYSAVLSRGPKLSPVLSVTTAINSPDSINYSLTVLPLPFAIAMALPGYLFHWSQN